MSCLPPSKKNSNQPAGLRRKTRPAQVACKLANRAFYRAIAEAAVGHHVGESGLLSFPWRRSAGHDHRSLAVTSQREERATPSIRSGRGQQKSARQEPFSTSCGSALVGCRPKRTMTTAANHNQVKTMHDV